MSQTQIKEVTSISEMQRLGDDKPVSPNSVNVIYFTNQCNMKCDYCYEDQAYKKRYPEHLTKEKMRELADEIIRKEPTGQTMCVLFGGEPTLRWDDVCYFAQYIMSLKDDVYFCCTSNGLRLKNKAFFNKFIDNYHNIFQNRLKLQISFDGVGQFYRRGLHGEDTTKTLANVLMKIKESGINFDVSYTLHRKNLPYIKEDVPRIFKVFAPNRIQINVAYNFLSHAEQNEVLEIANYFRTLFNNGQICPICGWCCDTCSGCGETKSNRSYYNEKGNIKTESNKANAPEFSHF